MFTRTGLRIIEESLVRRPYLNWHKTLGRGYYAMDVDALEVRDTPEGMRVKAITEIYNINAMLNGVTVLQSIVYPILKEKLGVEVYHVGTNSRCDIFVLQRYPEDVKLILTPQEYAEWLKNL